MNKKIIFTILILFVLIPSVYALDWTRGTGYFDNLYIQLTDTFGGDVSGTYDNLAVVDVTCSGSCVDDAEVDDDVTIDSTKWVNTTSGIGLIDDVVISMGTGDDVYSFFNSSSSCYEVHGPTAILKVC